MNKIYLTPEQAISCLIENESNSIHTFVNNGMLIGADWSKEDIIKELHKKGEIQIGGSSCKSMKHPIVFIPENAKWQSDLLFIEADMDKINKLGKELEEEL